MSENTNLVPKRRFKEFQNAGVWEQRKLGEVADVYDGTHQTPNYTYSGVMFLSVENIKTLQSEKFISEEDFKKEFAVFPEKGDVLMTRIGDIGTANVVESDDPKAYYVSLALLKQKELNPYFLKESISSKAVKKELWKRTLHIAFPKKINKNEIANVIVPYSVSKDEQQKIGEFFRNLDNLITFQQRKLEKMKSLKSAYLSEMFPAEGEREPKRRFAGFTGAWERRKFSETFIFLQNNSLSRAELNYEQGLVKNVHYGDVLIKFGEILDVEKEEIPFISNNEFNISNTSLLQNGDVIIADAAEDETVGKCSEIKGIDSISIISGLHTIPCRPNKTFATGYLGYYMNSSAYHDQLLPLIQGTKISSISKSALHNTNIIYPDSEQEQQKIGQFFQNLDHFITLQQRKLEKLKNIKKAFLNEMFI